MDVMKLAMDVCEWRWLGGKILAKVLPHLLRYDLPHGMFADASSVRQHVIEHAVGRRGILADSQDRGWYSCCCSPME